MTTQPDRNIKMAWILFTASIAVAVFLFTVHAGVEKHRGAVHKYTYQQGVEGLSEKMDMLNSKIDHIQSSVDRMMFGDRPLGRRSDRESEERQDR
jgi:hypothetical protein